MKTEILKEVLESDDKEMMLLCQDIEQAGEHKQNAKKACERNPLWRAFHRNVKLHEGRMESHAWVAGSSICLYSKRDKARASDADGSHAMPQAIDGRQFESERKNLQVVAHEKVLGKRKVVDTDGKET